MSANQLDKKSEAWSALFSEPMSELVQRYTASVGFDQRLWRADIAGSLAHAEMLAAQGVIARRTTWPTSERGMAQITRGDRVAAASSGSSSSRTCTSTSRRA